MLPCPGLKVVNYTASSQASAEPRLLPKVDYWLYQNKCDIATDLRLVLLVLENLDGQDGHDGSSNLG